ncbi:MAG: DUF3592 domain-containing protein [Planctomycetota bacterium]
MARTYRFYQKKRGNRRTGSHKLGSAGEALFFAACLLLGCGGLVILFLALVVPEWKANYEFVRTDCKLRRARVQQKAGDDGVLYRPEVEIEYHIDGEKHVVWTYDVHTLRGGGYSADREEAEAVRDRFEDKLGRQYLCYYDPDKPSDAVLVRGTAWWVWLSFLVPVSFILIGAGGLAYRIFDWGKSAERRAAPGKQATGQGDAAHNGSSRTTMPHVPVATKTTDSPGTRLAFRLPAARAPVWALFTWLTVSILWNGTVLVFVAIAVGGFIEGAPDWLLTAFIIPFVLIGVGLVVLLLRQLAVTTGIGPTLVEISDQPLYPGGRYRLFLSQTGRLRINSLELLLVCDEQSTYRLGTDTRREERRVHRQCLLRREELEITSGAPFEADCELQLPAGAMHSFKAGHNEILWKILVKGSPARWPDYERSFPVVVHPNRNGKNDR